MIQIHIQIQSPCHSISEHRLLSQAESGVTNVALGQQQVSTLHLLGDAPVWVAEGRSRRQLDKCNTSFLPVAEGGST